MNTSLKAVLQLLLIIAVVVAICAWGIDFESGSAVQWSLRISAPIIAVGIILLLVRTARRKEKLPDLLRERTGNYFERDGFCFAFIPAVIDGVLWMKLYYQNRYERQCIANVMLRPPKTWVGINRVPIDTLNIDIACEGAEFGVVTVPLAIPEKYQNRSVSFEVSCDTRYPDGRGKRRRYREGMRVGATKEQAGLSFLLLLVGHIHVRKSARQTFKFPADIATEVPASLEPRVQTLWLPSGHVHVSNASATLQPRDSSGLGGPTVN